MAWYIDGSASMGNLDVFQTDKTLGDYRVCMIDCDDETVSESDHEANAKLIAAAPDLLAALEAVLPDLWDGIELATEQSVNEAWLADALHRLDAARAAVNKAKGEA
jgi:hypothetical protein